MRLSEEELREIRQHDSDQFAANYSRSKIYVERRKLLVELGEVARERDEARAGSVRDQLQIGLLRGQLANLKAAAAATPEPSGAPTEYSDTDSEEFG